MNIYFLVRYFARFRSKNFESLIRHLDVRDGAVEDVIGLILAVDLNEFPGFAVVVEDRLRSIQELLDALLHDGLIAVVGFIPVDGDLVEGRRIE